MLQDSSVYRKKSLAKQGEDLGTEYVLDLLERFQLSQDEHRRVAKYCDEKGIMFMCTPWDLDSIASLEALDVKAYKVASADLTNLPLIERLIFTKKPLITSHLRNFVYVPPNFFYQLHAHLMQCLQIRVNSPDPDVTIEKPPNLNPDLTL